MHKSPATGWGSTMCLVRGRVTISEYWILRERRNTSVRKHVFPPDSVVSICILYLHSFSISDAFWISILFFACRSWPKFVSGYAASMEICVSHMRWSSMAEVRLTTHFCTYRYWTVILLDSCLTCLSLVEEISCEFVLAAGHAYDAGTSIYTTAACEASSPELKILRKLPQKFLCQWSAVLITFDIGRSI